MIKYMFIHKKKIILIIILFFTLFFYLFIIRNGQKGKIIHDDDIKRNNYKNENPDKTFLQHEEMEHIFIPKSHVASIPIFMYHWVREETGGYEYPDMMVKPSELKKQFEYVSNNNYESIFITDMEHIYKYKNPVAFTFDDGWVDVYTDVFPLAKEYNIKISMYIIKELVGTNAYCNEEQLKEMKESGLVDIHSHTVTHRMLATISINDVFNELIDSKKYLKETFKIDSTVICYPVGSTNNNVIKEAKRAGYKFGLLMDGGVYNSSINKELLAIPRIYAKRSMGINEFISYLKKSYVTVKY